MHCCLAGVNKKYLRLTSQLVLNVVERNTKTVFGMNIQPLFLYSELDKD